MKKKKKKHHACSPLIPSPDGRRKSTIRLNRDLRSMDFTIKQIERLEKDLEAFWGGLFQ